MLFCHLFYGCILFILYTIYLFCLYFFDLPVFYCRSIEYVVRILCSELVNIKHLFYLLGDLLNKKISRNAVILLKYFLCYQYIYDEQYK